MTRSEIRVNRLARIEVLRTEIADAERAIPLMQQRRMNNLVAVRQAALTNARAELARHERNEAREAAG